MKLEWTSVNEKLPEYGNKVLIWYQSQCYIAQLDEECSFCGQEDHFAPGYLQWCADLDQVTHWFALPKGPAPKEGKIKYAKPKKPLNSSFNTPLNKANKVRTTDKYKFWD